MEWNEGLGRKSINATLVRYALKATGRADAALTVIPARDSSHEDCITFL